MAANVSNLTTLIKRLEAATSRLEDLAESALDSTTASAVATDSNVTTPGITAAASPTPKALTQELPPSIFAFDTLINNEVKAFATKSQSIGGLVAEQASSVVKAFAAQRKFLLVATKSTKPDTQSQAYAEILKELQAALGPVDDVRIANRASPLFNHLNTVADGINMLSWVAFEPKPAETVTTALDSTKFFGNRVHKEYKDKDLMHGEWLQSYYRIFSALTRYIQDFYPTGITWNASGVDPIEALRSVQQQASDAPKATPSAYAPPPPPPLPSFNTPPPPPMPPNGTPGASASRDGDMGAVFWQLSQGEAVTANLRKVDASQMTHKNPALRTHSAIPALEDSGTRARSPVPSKRPKPESLRTKRPARVALDGTKWIVEHHDAPTEPIIIDAALSHSILITHCTRTTVIVRGKATAVSVDASTQVSLVIDSLVAAVDVVRSPRFELQVLGALPTVLLDRVDGATLYLGRQSLGTAIFTSQCAAINVNVPRGSDDDDYRECPLPEQIKTVIRNGMAVSEIVEHAG